MGLNGIAVIPVGDKFVKAVPLQTAQQAGQAFSTNGPADYASMGQYITHVVQLKFLKPSEVMQVLQPFASSAAT